MSGSESGHDSSLSMDESSNSAPDEKSKKQKRTLSSSNDNESSTDHDSSRSGASSPESSEDDSSDGSQKLTTDFLPFKPQKPLLTFEEFKSSDFEIWTVSVPSNVRITTLFMSRILLIKFL